MFFIMLCAVLTHIQKPSIAKCGKNCIPVCELKRLSGNVDYKANTCMANYTTVICGFHANESMKSCLYTSTSEQCTLLSEEKRAIVHVSIVTVLLSKYSSSVIGCICIARGILCLFFTLAQHPFYLLQCRMKCKRFK